MKILILVLSYNKPPFDELMRTQQETWDSIPETNVNTLYYYGGYENFIVNKIIRQHHKSTSYELQVSFKDDYYYMAGKMLHALNYIRGWDYDLIFRTNSSSYISKKKLVEFAATLPTEKLYAGWATHDSNSEDKGDTISGAGVWLSRDTAEILKNNIDPEFEMEEDVYCSRILRSHGIVPVDDKSRIDYPADTRDLSEAYHIRFKCGGPREEDIQNMRIVHNKIINQ